MQLSSVLASQFVLPSIPKVVALLLSEMERDEPDLKKITQLISVDPALAIRLMQLSNSGFFKLSGRVNSVSESLAVVGLSHVALAVNQELSDIACAIGALNHQLDVQCRNAGAQHLDHRILVVQQGGAVHVP